MDDDERLYGDAETRAEMAEDRYRRAKARGRRRMAWDEPPEYFDDDPPEYFDDDEEDGE